MEIPILLAPPVIEEKLNHGFTRLIQHYWETGGYEENRDYGYFVLARDWNHECGYVAILESNRNARNEILKEKTNLPLQDLQRWDDLLSQIKYPRIENDEMTFPDMGGVYAIDDSKIIFNYRGSASKSLRELDNLIDLIIETYFPSQPDCSKEAR